MSAAPAVVDAAVAQVEQGFAAFALRANAKVPVTEHGFKNATRKTDWIRTQLAAPNAGNYGIVWPEDSAIRVVVFDLDNGSDGRETPWEQRLGAHVDRIGPLPATKHTITPSGGRHVFYRWPSDVPIPPGDELFGFTVRWPGRGYLVGPGSSINGRPYVQGPSLVIADLPRAWVDAAVAEHTGRRAPASGEFEIPAGFTLPDVIPSGRRYSVIRDYVASRYNAGLGLDELWELVQTQVAPRFSVAKDTAALRADFDRVTEKIGDRLGAPAGVARAEAAAIAARPIEVVNLASIHVEAVVWLWHRFLPVGSVTLFDGNPGEGKSTIVADIIARLTTGGQWPDGTEVGAPGNVLYVTKEDDPATQVRPRIEAAGGDVSRVSFVSGDLLFPRDMPRFRELIEATQPRLIMLDPLMSYLEGKVKVISDNEVRSAIMTPLGELARSVGTAVLVIRHFNKGSGQSALNRGAGSLGGLSGAARLVLALATDTEVDDERARVFGVVKSNFEAKPPSLKALIESAPVEGFQMTVSRVSWHGQSATAISDLMERTREQHQQAADAEEDLRDILEPVGTEVKRAEVDAKMKTRGHAKTAAYAAARALRVVVKRSGYQGGTTWALPAPVIRPIRQNFLTNEDGTTWALPAPVIRPIRQNFLTNEANHSSDDLTNGTNEVSGHSSANTESLTNGMNGRMTDDPSPSFIHSSIGHEGPPRAGAREATCPVCHRAIELSAPGVLRSHYDRDDLPGAKWEVGICPGSGREPATLTVINADGGRIAVSAWCRYQTDHAFRHRDVQTPAPWCEICTPRAAP